ncbi:TMEM175 family protein [Mucilaginibacter litoreus]|uniref:TMEM175 family protein n=1 Tax=Mucilaginibacter litoreus TaxID=1048221 RepID=A0ABW3AUC6_9SPHI
MDIQESEEIKKEFQLERMVLFSDAVFAIIITIMVIEIKLPEDLHHASKEDIRRAIIHLLPKIGAYMMAFFITGMFWSRHLKLFSYLKDYTNSLIALNLAFLFFVSLFPLGISVMLDTLTPRNYDGLYMYFTIVLLGILTQTILTGHIIKHAQNLCIRPDGIESNLEWRAQRIQFIAIPILFIYCILCFLSQVSPQFISYGVIAWAAITGLIRKKLYPNKNSEPLLARIFYSRKRSRSNNTAK